MIKESQVIEKLRGVYDPEIPLNLYDLGLIYEIEIDDSDVTIVMSLTTPHCGLKDMIIDQVVMAVETIEDANCEVRLTFDPQWSPTMLREAAIHELGPNQKFGDLFAKFLFIFFIWTVIAFIFNIGW
jgi:metal-sulfur cluster biosynthetic enzyme